MAMHGWLQKPCNTQTGFIYTYKPHSTLTKLLLLQAAMVATVRRQYDIAIKHYTAAIDVRIYCGTYNAILYSERGIAYYRLGQHVRAISDTYKAVACDSAHPVPICLRGMCFKELGYYKSAIRVHILAEPCIARYQWSIAVLKAIHFMLYHC